MFKRFLFIMAAFFILAAGIWVLDNVIVYNRTHDDIAWEWQAIGFAIVAISAIVLTKAITPAPPKQGSNGKTPRSSPVGQNIAGQRWVRHG